MMKPIYHKTSISVITILLCMVSIRGSSQSGLFKDMDQVEEFKVNLKAFNDETKTLTSEFRQVKHLDILSQDIVTSGNFYYKKEDRLRWEYTEPFEYVIIFNENDILIRDENRESRYNTESNEMFRQISHLMTNVIQGDVLEETDNFSSRYMENGLEYQVILIPQSDLYKNFFRQIEIYFGKIDLMVRKLIFLEQSEDNTQIEFFNKKRNETIPDTVFETH